MVNSACIVVNPGLRSSQFSLYCGQFRFAELSFYLCIMVNLVCIVAN